MFATLSYSDGRWRRGRPTAVPFLLVDVHDSDLATVDYRFADATGGRFYLGYEPRVYFEEPDAAPPVDTAEEAAGLALQPLLVSESLERFLDVHGLGAGPIEA